MDKRFLVDQLIAQLDTSAQTALRASEDAALQARDGATPQEKREDARVALEFGRMSTAQSQRAQRALQEIDALTAFRAGPLAANARIALGAIVEVEDAESGEGRTSFLTPVVGRRRAHRSRRRNVREWTITWVG